MDDLIPVRALNQVTYCPCLYYLEYVKPIMPTNEHVEDALFQHRRVDDPNLQHKPRKEGEALCIVGFDPCCGFFHAGRHGKPSLALDMLEEFRSTYTGFVVR